jgi:hypothetical protein
MPDAPTIARTPMTEATWLRLRLAELPAVPPHAAPEIREEAADERAYRVLILRDELRERGARLDTTGALQWIDHLGHGASAGGGLEPLFRAWVAAVARAHGEAA